MKIFGIGLNKTGTTSLGQCFKVLGFKHAPYHRKLLHAWHQGDLGPAFAMAARYETFEDWPWPLMFRELDERYPDALFVLTERPSPQKWFESLCHHAERGSGTPWVREIAYGYPMPQGHEQELIARYEAHGNAVREHFADRPGKLLQACWETGSGWSELCGFVGRPIPDVAFPHANRRPD